MARFARVVVPGLAHHITQRGNYRQQVFFCDEDFRTYLGLLQHYAGQSELRVVGYCLMRNHVHLVVVPGREDSLARALGRAHCRYAQWAHARQHCVGHLWQNRFFSTVLDERHLIAAMRYVERNPVRAAMVDAAVEYTWSSAAAHATGRDSWGLLDLAFWTSRFAPEQWRVQLQGEEDAADIESVRQHTETGRPLGTKEFVAEVGRMLKRTLEPRSPGRPKKVAEEDVAKAQISMFG